MPVMSSSNAVPLTLNIPGGNISETLPASVVGADATATTLYVTCQDSELRECDYTITFGPWAHVTPPPQASTGTFDRNETIVFIPYNSTGPYPAYSSVKNLETGHWHMHCNMISTTIVHYCTTTYHYSPATDIDPFISTTAAFDSEALSMDHLGMGFQPFAITAGAEKLLSSTSSTSSSQIAAMFPATISAPPATTAASGSVASATHAGSASRATGTLGGTLSLVAVMVTIIL